MKRLLPALLALCLLASCAQTEEAPQPTPTPYPGLDEKGWVIFDPPGKLDTALYDTTAIKAAFASGETEGLNEKDVRVLGCVKSVMGRYVKEDMSDLEKEVALHDWLMTVGQFDRSIYDPRTPQGADDSSMPYGLLINGAGTSTGYATSFQLFMDLCEVECLTVVGAAFNSMEDHVWNLVKLEGEWYCVDPSWNKVSEDHHAYLNVTSDFMRQTDHQWDYKKVPEATGTRLRPAD